MKMNSRPGLRLALAAICLAAAAGRAQFLETEIPVGDTPTDVLWNPASNKVYTANSQGGTVTVIDGATNQILATVPVADDPTFLCYNSVANKVYCTSGDPDWLYVIDGVGDTLIRKVRMRGAPTRMVFNALMNKLYVLCYDDQMVRVYDGSVDTLVAEVWVGSTPGGALLWHPVSERVFCPVVWYSDIDTVVVVDCATDEIVARRPVGRLPYAICWNPVNDLVYVATRYAIYALSPTGDSVVVQVPGYAIDVCAVPFSNKLYATRGPGLSVIDCYTHTVVDSLAMSAGIWICDTVRAKAYATGNPAPVVDARADTLVTTIPMGRSSDALCWNRTNSRVYIADAMDDAVYVIRDTATGVAEPAVAAINLSPLIVASPNPFTRAVAIECGAQLAPGAGVCIFSQDGRQVRRLALGLTLPGSPRTSTWDGKDELGRRVARGVYLAVVEGQAGVRAKLVKLD
jgi:YVTN family beta-propeller protein